MRWEVIGLNAVLAGIRSRYAWPISLCFIIL